MDKYRYLQDLKHAFDSFSSGICIVDRSGVVETFNTISSKLLGRYPQAIEANMIYDILPGVWDDIAGMLKTGKSIAGKEVIIGKIKLIADISPIKIDGQIPLIILVFQKKANYGQSHKEFQSIKSLVEIIENRRHESVDGFWVNDRHGRVVAISETAAKRSNLKKDEAIGMLAQDFVTSGTVDRIVTSEVIETKASVTYIQTLENGKQLLSTGTPLFDHLGDVDLIVVSENEILDNRILPANFKKEQVMVHLPDPLSSDLSHDPDSPSSFVLHSRKLKDVFNKAMRVAAVDSGVLIQGESGTGKTFFAKIIHNASERKTSPFRRVDCGAIPETLVESELFGYEKGAFTGAKAKGKPGQIEMTQGGTLFLDEVAELPLNVQAKILRFLDDKKIVRVGGTRAIKIDLRIIAATNKDLKQMVKKGHFRNDLYFRLNVVPLKIPPLRERIEDIGPFIKFFIDKLNRKYSTQRAILPSAVKCMKQYPFPGNVRELANLVERIVVLSLNQQIDTADLPHSILQDRTVIEHPSRKDSWILPQAVAEFERNFIIQALATFGSQRKAADKIGIKQSTLSRKVKLYKITHDEIIHHDE
ncbi:MAG: sigma 54-interacting transcriptional regulator [Deltaproteobacteria bacterium]|nr:sigma 54-interacting transcriptional regulator [Deltaproteobacteria bacterium]